VNTGNEFRGGFKHFAECTFITDIHFVKDKSLFLIFFRETNNIGHLFERNGIGIDQIVHDHHTIAANKQGRKDCASQK
jgi:hypothetical protein